MCVLVGKLWVAIITAVVFAIIYIPTMRGEEDYLLQVYGQDFP